MTGLNDPAVLARYGRDPQDVARQLRATLADLEAALEQTQDRWFTPVAEALAQAGPGLSGPRRPGSYQLAWSPAQQAEHLIKAGVSFSKIISLLRGERPLPEVRREPGPRREDRLVSPPQFEPGAGQPWAELAGPWHETHARLLREIEQIDPSCTRVFWHPYFGDLGPLDWGRVAVAHARSHRQQLGVDG